MSKRKPTYRKRFLIEGDKNGRMPHPRWKKWGWWYWPTTAIALAAGTYWGTQHIEIHLEQAAPSIVEKAGIDATGLKFKARHRIMDVSGTLPAGVSTDQLEHILASYKGPDGESIRTANVHTTTSSIKSENTVKPVEIISEADTTEKVDISVTADIQNDTIRLMGVVPSRSHAETLLGAARQNYSEDNIDDLLIVAEQEANISNPDLYIGSMASIISNLKGNADNAQLYLDNDFLAGDIYAKTDDDKKIIRAMIPNKAIKVFHSDTGSQSNWTVPEPDENTVVFDSAPVVTNAKATLQTRISALEQEISANVVFAPASDVLELTAYEVLDKVADIILSTPGQLVQVAGHTDSHSDDTSNLILSEKRAKAVVRYLEKRGINADDLMAAGYGESQPIFTNDTAEGRAKNRRVEFWVLQNNSTDTNY